MVQLYITFNNDWNYSDKCKYGVVEGDTLLNLSEKLLDSVQQHSELSYYVRCWLVGKSDDYTLPYQEIDKLFSIVAKDTKKIDWIENKCNVKLDNFRELNKYLVKGIEGNCFLEKKGISTVSKLILEDFPKIGLFAISEYSQKVLSEINYDSKLEYLQSLKYQSENDTFIWNL